MSFTENLKVEIESVFNSKGFKKFDARMKQARKEVVAMSQLFRSAEKNAGLRKFGRDFNDRMERAGLSVRNINSSLDGTGNKFFQVRRALEGMDVGIKNFDSLDEAAGAARRQIDEFNGIIIDNDNELRKSGRAVQGMTNQFDNLGAMIENVPKEKNIPNPMAQFDGVGEKVSSAGTQRTISFGEMDTSRAERGLLRLSKVTDISNRKLRRLAGLSAFASAGLQKLSSGAKKAAASVMKTSVSLQSLQMRLLGVQFSLLSLAFIFGGLMMSALSAVGIFEILGNTLKMFFLPTALDLIPAVLDLRDAILSIDDETKKSIGRIFVIVTAVGALGSILAFATSGVLGFLQGIKMLFSPFTRLLVWLTDAGSVLQLVKNGFSAVKAIAGGLKAAIGGIISFLAGFAAGFLIVTRTAKKFGKKVAAMVGMVVSLLAGIGAAVALFLGAPFFLVAGLIGVAFGAIAGILWTFRDTIIGIFVGIGKGVMGALKWLFGAIKNVFNKIVNTVVDLAGGLFDTLVGNSIFPDMVKEIIDWFFKIPKKIVDLGSSIVSTIVDGIKNAGSSIWDAFKKILPDFLVDAIEGAGKAVKGIVGAGGDIVGSAGETIGKVGEGLFDGVKDFGSNVVSGAKDFVSGGSDKANNAAPKEGGDNGGQTIQNDITANVNYQGESSTPQEDGRRWARGGTEEINNRQSSSFSSGT